MSGNALGADILFPDKMSGNALGADILFWRWLVDYLIRDTTAEAGWNSPSTSTFLQCLILAMLMAVPFIFLLNRIGTRSRPPGLAREALSSRETIRRRLGRFIPPS